LTASPLNEERVRIDQEYREMQERIQQIISPKKKVVFELKTLFARATSFRTF